jgi:chemotaxis protein CheD
VDTAVVGLLAELEQTAGRRLRPKLTAKLFGGASMFQSAGPLEIGKFNRQAAERVLDELGIAVLACDMGGDAGRHLTFDTSTGIVAVRVPGGADYRV